MVPNILFSNNMHRTMILIRVVNHTQSSNYFVVEHKKDSEVFDSSNKPCFYYL